MFWYEFVKWTKNLIAIVVISFQLWPKVSDHMWCSNIPLPDDARKGFIDDPRVFFRHVSASIEVDEDPWGHQLSLRWLVPVHVPNHDVHKRRMPGGGSGHHQAGNGVIGKDKIGQQPRVK